MKRKLCLLLLLIIAWDLSVHACEETRAAFDIGSGTTKMKVYKYDACQKKLLSQVEEAKGNSCEADRKVSYKEDLKAASSLKRSTVEFGLKALLELRKIAADCGATKFSAVATSAFRQASNGKNARSYLEEKSKIRISIIDQKEEAIIGFNGAAAKSGLKTEGLCVWDIGGSSMQIVCDTKEGQKFFLGHLASVPFKNFIIENKMTGVDLSSPNPVTDKDYSLAFERTKKEAKEIESTLGDSIKNNRVLGIGGVHYYAVSKVINLSEYSANDISQSIKSKLNLSDKELGGGKYVDTAVSNLILVEGIMRGLDVSKVRALKVNLTEGLVSSSQYWN
ncbi:MAG: Ppx/GppA phosphatase family protein [Bacteriovoracaceae bacterium]